MFRSLVLPFSVAMAILGSCAEGHASDHLIPVLPHTDGGPGGQIYNFGCGLNGDFATGVTIRSGAWVDAIGLHCARFDPNGNALSVAPHDTRFTGGSGGAPQSAQCYPTEYLAGLKVGFTRDGNQPRFLDYVELICTPVHGGGENRRCLQTGNGCWDKHPNEGPYNGYGLSFEERCRPNQAVTGLAGTSGIYVDSIGVYCSSRR